jgi:thiamine monophosphate kinase
LSTLGYEGLKEAELIRILSAGGDYELLFTASPNIRQKIEALSLELSSDSKLIRCGKVGPNDAKGLVSIKTTQGIFSTTELARQFNLAHLGNDHYGLKNTAA